MIDHDADALIERWCHDVIARHTVQLTKPEFLKAVRALSARYVERRDELSHASPLDSAGKRAAFAAFFAPLHLITARAVVSALNAAGTPLDRIVDLGCGTGVASAAWALAHPSRRPSILGVDRHAWSLGEAAWTWQRLQLSGRTQRGNLTTAIGELTQARGRNRATLARTGIVLGWTINELTPDDRRVLLAALTDLGSRGARILIIEPIANRASPWWNEWATHLSRIGARADTWTFDLALPRGLGDLDEAAGFQRDQLTARSIFLTQ